MALSFAEIGHLLRSVGHGDEDAVREVRDHNVRLTKPVGSLGRLESIVEFLARWQRSPTPVLGNITVAIFAANHGVAAQGVSAYPPSVTAQMVRNFSEGGAAISQICSLHGLGLRVVELELDRPTGDITLGPAMHEVDCVHAIEIGMQVAATRPDLLCLGEMGIGNSTPAAALYAALYGGKGEDWVGRGTGVDDAGLARKASAVDRALELHHNALGDPLGTLACLGGREIAAILGAILGARHYDVPVFIDGFVVTSAASVAYAVNPSALDHCLFAHTSAEQGHRRALAQMAKTGLLDMQMRLGEGTGAALAAVMAKTALYVHEHMATFQSAGVSEKSLL